MKKLRFISIVVLGFASLYASSIETILLQTKSYNISGEFASYDFNKNGLIEPSDWTFKSSDGSVYQLLGDTSETNVAKYGVFGWKPLSDFTPNTPSFYLTYLGKDVDGDGSTKFDWVVVDNSSGSTYKLAGQNTTTKSFSYENTSNIKASIDTSSKTIIFTSTIATSSSTLSNEQKYALAFMWHEEKMAYDIYNELYKINPAQQLKNIANNSEIKHIGFVQDLVKKYDINITNLKDYAVNYSQVELEALPVGKFAIEPIQKLYDTLYEKGIKTMQDTFEVGCMVEVTDVNDLNEFIAKSGAMTDIIDTFTILRDDSYTHYWAFDSGLKTLGVFNGCCSLGDTYCKTAQEYPSTKGNN